MAIARRGHHRRGRELGTVVSDLDRGRVAKVLDGRSRRRVERYLRSLAEPEAIEVVSIAPYEAGPPVDPERAALARIVVDCAVLAPGMRWKLAYFDEPTTNGYAEGVINKVKPIKHAPTNCPASTASETACS
jgi:hypothetical protein